MSLDNVKKLINFLADNNVGQITFSGGEPTLYPYLKNAIEEAIDCGMTVHMNSNGYIFNEKLAKELYSLGLTQVQINIDSLNPRKHDSVRGMKGSWGREEPEPLLPQGCEPELPRTPLEDPL